MSHRHGYYQADPQCHEMSVKYWNPISTALHNRANAKTRRFNTCFKAVIAQKTFRNAKSQTSPATIAETLLSLISPLRSGKSAETSSATTVESNNKSESLLSHSDTSLMTSSAPRAPSRCNLSMTRCCLSTLRCSCLMTWLNSVLSASSCGWLRDGGEGF